jgi:hypothetical protein
LKTIFQELTMVDSGKASTSKASHPLVVLVSRDHIIQTFMTVEGHAVPINLMLTPLTPQYWV